VTGKIPPNTDCETGSRKRAGLERWPLPGNIVSSLHSLKKEFQKISIRNS
jgi:hypothetical protein